MKKERTKKEKLVRLNKTRSSKGETYILSNKNRTTFYIGVTNDIMRRMSEHKAGIGSKFCYKYNLTDLLFYQKFDSITEAIANEKRYKNWHRDWKIKMIKQFNPEMKDAAADWFTAEKIESIRRENKENKK
jgi:putative endonuclease